MRVASEAAGFYYEAFTSVRVVLVAFFSVRGTLHSKDLLCAHSCHPEHAFLVPRAEPSHFSLYSWYFPLRSSPTFLSFVVTSSLICFFLVLCGVGPVSNYRGSQGIYTLGARGVRSTAGRGSLPQRPTEEGRCGRHLVSRPQPFSTTSVL